MFWKEVHWCNLPIIILYSGDYKTIRTAALNGWFTFFGDRGLPFIRHKGLSLEYLNTVSYDERSTDVPTTALYTEDEQTIRTAAGKWLILIFGGTGAFPLLTTKRKRLGPPSFVLPAHIFLQTKTTDVQAIFKWIVIPMNCCGKRLLPICDSQLPPLYPLKIWGLEVQNIWAGSVFMIVLKALPAPTYAIICSTSTLFSHTYFHLIAKPYCVALHS